MKKRKLLPVIPTINQPVDSDDVNVLRQQLKAAQARIRHLEEDVTILKKATAYFAKEDRK